MRTGLFLADADGGQGKSLLPAEGLDYNAAFSADGRWIVFTSERAGSADIYRVRPDGTRLERLTDDPAYDDQAALSPDGSQFAFASTRGSGRTHIWLLHLATRRYRILTDGPGGDFRPSWSPDSKWIAFTSDRGAHPGRIRNHWEFLQSTSVYIIRADGTGLRRLTQPGGFAGSPKWSPDGRRIVYYEADVQTSWSARSRVAPKIDFTSQIASMDVATGVRKEETSGPGVKVSPQWLSGDRIAYVRKQGPDPGLEFTSGEKGARGEFRNPAWSPDGKRVVYDRELPAERPPLAPTFSRDPDFELTLTEPFPAYSPSGDRLVVSGRPPHAGPYFFEESGLEVMNADGSQGRMIFNQPGANAYAASWSPRGDQIAFGVGTFFARPMKPAQVALIKPDGSGFHLITNGEINNAFPSWSPDGRRLVYRADGKEGQGLVILSLADGKVTPLATGSPYDNFPAWSPRGDRLAFTGFRDGNYDIYTVRPNGTDLRRLTRSGGNDAHCVWSPDGEWILFSSSRMGFKDEAPLFYRIPQPYGELFAMRSDGTGVRQLTDNQWEDATPAWMPDGGRHCAGIKAPPWCPNRTAASHSTSLISSASMCR